MKDNRSLGFETIHRISEGTGSVARLVSANVIVGRRGDTYRAYAYIWQHDQDASREGVIDSLCARADSAEEAMEEIVRRAVSHWSSARVAATKQAVLEVQESLDEDGERDDD